MATIADKTTTVSTITTVVETKDLGEGKYELNEIQSDPFVPPETHSNNRKQVDVPLPVPGLGVTVYVDLDDKEIGAYSTLAGSQLGTKYVASLTKGIQIGINLAIASGSISINYTNNKVRLGYKLSAGVWPFQKSWQDEKDIISL